MSWDGAEPQSLQELPLVGPIDSCLPNHGICRKHMKTVHMNFVCDDWEPLWGERE
ncbi:hypothetical protein [Thermococcus sp. Bubb.Bath]|uniref:hypothetical protein n=1 Tax=Thermococcus sp. Bubb.Bath TaxID=1638242 RepID=UPI001438E967|nr:hypothetical protein [Thermococcus sp. Bubb.Bath]